MKLNFIEYGRRVCLAANRSNQMRKGRDKNFATIKVVSGDLYYIWRIEKYWTIGKVRETPQLKISREDGSYNKPSVIWILCVWKGWWDIDDIEQQLRQQDLNKKKQCDWKPGNYSTKNIMLPLL